ncbi:MAG: hypothetical protein ACMUIU_10100 [bacterium]
MPEHLISELFEIRTRYLRSIHLERDFHNQQILTSYILTPHTQSGLNQIFNSLSHDSGRRAWRITGDYGAGKSSFALVLAHLLSSKNKKLPKNLLNAIEFRTIRSPKPNYLPILITGSRSPIDITILKALLHSLIESCIGGECPNIINEIHSAIKTYNEIPIPLEAFSNLIRETNNYLHSTGKANGVLIIIDELGKFLEFAALHPDRQDIYFLQTLAESAARSKERPILVVGLLHQGFNAYADQLSQPAQREWEKVAGRFDEILFNQPLEQIALLVANALNVNTKLLSSELKKQAERDMSRVLDLNWYGAGASNNNLIQNSQHLFPLHPSTLPVLVHFFRRFGQNERSLFNFLLSNESFSLAEFSNNKITTDQFFRIHHFYDYARANFGYRLSVQSYRSHWNQIESIVESFRSENEIELKVLKTIALLNLLDLNNLVAMDGAIEVCVGNISEKVKATLKKLNKSKNILYDRGTAGGYCLWPYTSVNLDNAYNDALKSVSTPQRITPFIKEYLETRPLVARRHYIKTGNLRHFEIKYVTADEVHYHLSVEHKNSDGRILIPLCETEEERHTAIKLAKNEACRKWPNLLIAVPKPLYNLVGLIMECKRWDWISKNVPQLNNDSYAFEEVSRQIEASRQIFQTQISNYIGLRFSTAQTRLEWFRLSESISVENGRCLLSLLSDISDEVYNQAPIVLNELINRREPSSAASGARIKLIKKMFESTAKPYLGMLPEKKPPEMSLYLSFLKKSNLHRETENGCDLLLPDKKEDHCNFRPVFKKISDLIKNEKNPKINLSEVYSELIRPPFGIREGLLPLFIAAFSIMHDSETAFYENDVFMKEITGEDFRRLIKTPESFDIQYCNISGIRRIIFEQLLDVLQITPSKPEKSDIIDFVRPLMLFASRLPEFTLSTKRLSDKTLSVKEILLKAKEPVHLIFRDLPLAFGIRPFNSSKDAEKKEIQTYVNLLKESINELKSAYPKLLQSIKDEIRILFELPDFNDFSKSRSHLAKIAETIILSINELKLKSLCLRLMDDNLSESQWLESVASVIRSKPPSKWSDSDFNQFSDELSVLVKRFKNVESMVFDDSVSQDKNAIRIAITQKDGNEVHKVFHFDKKEEKLIFELEKKIKQILKENKRIGAVAVSLAILRELS